MRQSGEQKHWPVGGIVGKSLEVLSAWSIPVSAWIAPRVSRTGPSPEEVHTMWTEFPRKRWREKSGEVDFYSVAMLWQNSHSQ